MKFLLIALLIITACKKKDSASEEESTGTSQTSTPETVTDPLPAPSTVPIPSIPSAEAETIDKRFQSLINNHRIDLGLDPLIFDPALNKIVTTHSENMAKGTIAFGHSGFSSRCAAGRTALGGGNLCAENVATGQKTPEAAFDAWINSSGHKANIEQSRVTHTGFGYSKSTSGTWYWTQIFIEKN